MASHSWHNTQAKSDGNDIRCPHCNCAHCPVRHTEHREISINGQTRRITRRHRVCRHCQCPFTTVETYESDDQLGLPDIGVTPLDPADGFHISPRQTPENRPLAADSPSLRPQSGDNSPDTSPPSPPKKKSKPPQPSKGNRGTSTPRNPYL